MIFDLLKYYQDQDHYYYVNYYYYYYYTNYFWFTISLCIININFFYYWCHMLIHVVLIYALCGNNKY